MSAEPSGGRLLLDTNILIWRRCLPTGLFRGAISISAVTLAELSAGVNMVQGSGPVAIEERALRAAVLQQTENEFDPIPFGPDAARIFGRMCAAVLANGRKPRRRVADLMIAATAAAEDLELCTMNPDDFVGLDKLVRVIPVPRPATDTPASPGRERPNSQ